jgi:hypothetical protein
VSLFGETTDVTTSGVVVVNDDREIWATPVSKNRLGFTGRVEIRVGGVGWSEVVSVKRRGWSAVGGGTAYQVWLRGPDAENWTRTFSSEPAVAEAAISNRSVAIVPGSDRFAVHVVQNNSTVADAPIPAKGESVTIDGIRFERDGRKLYAALDGTRVRVAVREEYN